MILASLILFVLGLLVRLFLHGYSFTAYVLWGLGALVLAYRLLGFLGVGHPGPARLLRTGLTVCVILGVLAAVITGTFIYYASLGSPETACRYVIVLGCGVNGTEPSLSLRYRIDAAYEYLTAHPESVAVLSGGQGPDEDMTEAACMYRELTELGIDGERLWLEEKSTSTLENLEFSLNIIEKKTGSRPTEAGIVSSEYHLFRAGLMAKDKGFTAVGIPAKTGWFSLWANYQMREIVAVWAYLLLH